MSRVSSVTGGSGRIWPHSYDRIASRAASRRCGCASRAPGSRSQAATGRRMRAGWCGGTARPSGKSPPVSSKRMTPLHSRLHPCSGWKAMVWAASRSERSAGGHGGRCGHMASLWIRSCGRTWTVGPCWRGAGPFLVTALAKTVGVGRWPAPAGAWLAAAWPGPRWRGPAAPRRQAS